MIRESGGRSGWCSSQRVLVQLTASAGWRVGDNDSHGVEISIARGVEEMVRGNSLAAKGPPFIEGPSPNPNPL